jgi:hypothetical protein
MALYTVVDDGYDVDVFKSFEALWKSVSQCHRRTEDNTPLWLDESESVRLTKSEFRRELSEHGCARIFEDGYGSDWTLKVQRQ